jgi:hypothetical protein
MRNVMPELCNAAALAIARVLQAHDGKRWKLGDTERHGGLLVDRGVSPGQAHEEYFQLSLFRLVEFNCLDRSGCCIA